MNILGYVWIIGTVILVLTLAAPRILAIGNWSDSARSIIGRMHGLGAMLLFGGGVCAGLYLIASTVAMALFDVALPGW